MVLVSGCHNQFANIALLKNTKECATALEMRQLLKDDAHIPCPVDSYRDDATPLPALTSTKPTQNGYVCVVE